MQHFHFVLLNLPWWSNRVLFTWFEVMRWCHLLSSHLVIIRLMCDALRLSLSIQVPAHARELIWAVGQGGGVLLKALPATTTKSKRQRFYNVTA